MKYSTQINGRRHKYQSVSAWQRMITSQIIYTLNISR